MKKDPNKVVGMQYGIYLIKSCTGEKDAYNHWLYEGECQECGYRRIAAIGDFRSPSKIKDTCSHISMDGSYITKTSWSNKRIQHIYNGMRCRCYSSNDKNFPTYGGKGIKICREWLRNPISFEKWALSHGYTDEMTIDRIDSNKDYSPGNCRWITLEENARYKSTTRLIKVDDETHTGREWASILGVGTNRINRMIRNHGIENTVSYIRNTYKNPASVPA